MTTNHYRSTRRFTIPKSLVIQLDQEAARRGVQTERVVEEIVMQALPGMLATASEQFLRESIRLAEDHDQAATSADTYRTCARLD